MKYILTILKKIWLITRSVTINFSKMITNPSHHDDELQVETRSQRRRYLLHLFFLCSLTAQISPELKILIRNMAQDTSAYYSVVNIFIYFYETKNTTSITKHFPFQSRNLLQELIRHFPSIFHFSWKRKKLRYKL